MKKLSCLICKRLGRVKNLQLMTWSIMALNFKVTWMIMSSNFWLTWLILSLWSWLMWLIMSLYFRVTWLILSLKLADMIDHVTLKLGDVMEYITQLQSDFVIITNYWEKKIRSKVPKPSALYAQLPSHWLIWMVIISAHMALS